MAAEGAHCPLAKDSRGPFARAECGDEVVDKCQGDDKSNAHWPLAKESREAFASAQCGKALTHTCQDSGRAGAHWPLAKASRDSFAGVDIPSASGLHRHELGNPKTRR